MLVAVPSVRTAGLRTHGMAAVMAKVEAGAVTTAIVIGKAATRISSLNALVRRKPQRITDDIERNARVWG